MTKSARIFCVLLAVAVTGCTITGATAATNLFTFTDGSASITMPSKNRALMSVGAGADAGIYRKAISKKLLRKVKFSFVSQGDVQGGAPRLSIPVDTDGNPMTVEGYAFIDAAGCGATVGDNPDNVATVVATTNPACHVNLLGVDYANWQALTDRHTGAHPTWTLAKGDPNGAGGAAWFIIADQPGTYDVTKINLH